MPVKELQERAQERTPLKHPKRNPRPTMHAASAIPPYPTWPAWAEPAAPSPSSHPVALDAPFPHKAPQGPRPDKGVRAQNKSLDFPYQLQQLMGTGTVPVRLDVSGHSLGAGVASICAVWASLTWPTADVRLVTFGSPKVGPRTPGLDHLDQLVT